MSTPDLSPSSTPSEAISQDPGTSPEASTDKASPTVSPGFWASLTADFQRDPKATIEGFLRLRDSAAGFVIGLTDRAVDRFADRLADRLSKNLRDHVSNRFAKDLAFHMNRVDREDRKKNAESAG